MARRPAGIMGGYRKARNIMYRGARIMGNAQPWASYVAGEVDTAGLVRGVTRRQVRRWAGRAFSHLSFGDRGGWWGALVDVAIMLAGRFVGLKGRR